MGTQSHLKGPLIPRTLIKADPWGAVQIVLLLNQTEPRNPRHGGWACRTRHRAVTSMYLNQAWLWEIYCTWSELGRLMIKLLQWFLLTVLGPQGASLIGYRWQSFSLWALVHFGIVLKGHLETFPRTNPIEMKEEYHVSTDVHFNRLAEEMFSGACALGKTQSVILIVMLQKLQNKPPNPCNQHFQINSPTSLWFR